MGYLGKAVVISGTPGVGKTAVARKLADRLGATYVNLSELAVSTGAYQYFDESRGTYVVDEGKLGEVVSNLIRGEEGYVVVDSHYGEIVDPELVEKIFVLRMKPSVLAERLRARGWSDSKVAENVESELLGVCTGNAIERHGQEKVCEIDVTSLSVDEAVEEILKILEGVMECSVGVDWLELSEEVDYVLKLRRYG